ncbi:hypothetical protein TMatcc_004432 [Talaromyces marneffei ATCC 18224]
MQQSLKDQQFLSGALSRIPSQSYLGKGLHLRAAQPLVKHVSKLRKLGNANLAHIKPFKVYLGL